MRRLLIVLSLLVAAGTLAPARQELRPAAPSGPVRFAVIGDNGTGEQPQLDVAAQMATARATFPFEFVIMLGDNVYGKQDLAAKFARPYAALLSAGVQFYAALGNHDDERNRGYREWNMNGARYYEFAKGDARFFVLDSNMLDPQQVTWIEHELERARENWKICYFHHPLYSDARTHGPSIELRVVLEPIFVRYGVDAVFAGHEHVYERIKPQKGITYFIEGSSGQLRSGDIKASAQTAAYFDQDRAFMLVEIAGDDLTFRTISRTGAVVDSGVVHRRPVT